MGVILGIQTLYKVFSKYRWHVVVLVVLGSTSAILEGIGINMVIPLMSFFSGGSGEPTDFVTKTISQLFNFLSIPFSFRYLLGFILLLFFVRAIAAVVFGYIRSWIYSDFMSDETEEVLRSTLLASWPFLLRQKIGTLHNTIVRDIQRMGGLLDVLGQAIQSISGFLMYLLIAFNISSTMTLLTIGGGLVLFLFVKPLLARTRRTGAEMATTEKGLAQFLSEHIIGMKSVKASGVERRALHSSSQLIRRLRALSIKMGLIRSLSSSMFQPFSLIFIIIIFALTYNTPGFSIISFGAVLYLIQKIFTYLESGQVALHNISELLPYAQNVSNFKRDLNRHREETQKEGLPFAFKKSLKFRDVSFSYQEGAPVLSNISFAVAPGETVGVVGPSGAGKTSVADLVLRLFKPTKGEIVLDEMSIESISLEDWRKNIAYVSQDVFLLNTTIEENIKFYRSSVTHDEIVAAAKLANIYDTVMSFKDGFNTVVGDRGVMLSGGQRQRIALARALVEKPSLLILDEATSALDHESERLIQESIKSLHGTVTVLTIAHRPSTVAEADRIVVLDGGRVIETGSAAELLEDKNSYFYKMQHSL